MEYKIMYEVLIFGSSSRFTNHTSRASATTQLQPQLQAYCRPLRVHDEAINSLTIASGLPVVLKWVRTEP